MSMRYWPGLLLLAALWGGSFLFMRVGAPAFGPIPLIGLRLLLGALPLLPLLWWRGGFAEWRQYAKPIFVAGLFNSAFPFCLIAWSELVLPAGLASILNATTSLMAALWAVPMAREKLTPVRLGGIALGFIGVVVLTQHGVSDANGSINWLPVLAMLLATASYGWVGHYVKKHLVGVQALTVTTGSLASSALVLLPGTYLFWPKESVALNAWISVGALALLSTALAYLIYYRLIAHLGATRAAAVTYLIPLFGVLWGVLFLNEPLEVSMLFGMPLILGGVALINKPQQPKAVALAK